MWWSLCLIEVEKWKGGKVEERSGKVEEGSVERSGWKDEDWIEQDGGISDI